MAKVVCQILANLKQCAEMVFIFPTFHCHRPKTATICNKFFQISLFYSPKLIFCCEIEKTIAENRNNLQTFFFQSFEILLHFIRQSQFTVTKMREFAKKLQQFAETVPIFPTFYCRGLKKLVKTAIICRNSFKFRGFIRQRWFSVTKMKEFAIKSQQFAEIVSFFPTFYCHRLKHRPKTATICKNSFNFLKFCHVSFTKVDFFVTKIKEFAKYCNNSQK